jgi:hypothetical protein
MAVGIVYTDGTTDVQVHVSDEATSTAFASATFTHGIRELKGITQNAGTSAQIDLTHFKSSTRERRAGLGDPGSFQFTCNAVLLEESTATGTGATRAAHFESQALVYYLWTTGAVRWWRITLPKAYSNSTTNTSAGALADSGAMIGFSGSVDSSNFSISGTDEPAEFTFSVLVDSFSPGLVPETLNVANDDVE